VAFSLETYDRRYLEGMTRLFNAETAGEGHIAKLDPGLFMALVESKSAFDPAGLFVAVERGAVMGWAHACVALPTEPYQEATQPFPQIRMLIFPRDRSKVGGALVAEATEWLKRSGQTQLLAIHAQRGYPFYRGLWMGGEPMGPNSLPQVQVALEVGGYKNVQESIFMAGEMTSPPEEYEAAAPIELIDEPAEMKHEGMRESWIGFQPMRTRAMLGEQEAGSMGWVMLPHMASKLGAPAMNIWGLGVREEHRRKGIAAALIGRAMRLSYAQGARFCSVGTQLWNAPAHATYAKFGFVPHCVMVGRTLDLEAGK
jgi:GNAT superfamily N-acetyltransferase